MTDAGQIDAPGMGDGGDRSWVRPPPWRDVWWRELLVVTGLTGFAISQPMLSLLGENPTVFTFHGVDQARLVGFALGLALLPPVVLWLLGAAATAIDDRFGWSTHLATVGLLGGLAAVQVVKAAGLERTAAILVTSAIVALGLTWAYNRFALIATWLQFTAVLPAIAVLLFLFASPSGDLLRGRDQVTAPERDRNDLAPVVVVVLDELPTRSILDDQDHIDAVRFPNLARFAEDATWYRRYTTVAPSTQYAVPAMLTGNPPEQVAPLWTNYPDNLFSLLAPTHDLVAFETATELCGLDTCSQAPPGTATRPVRFGDLVSTTADLLRERVAPRPDRGERLDTFEEEQAQGTTPGLERVDRFVTSLAPRKDRPALFFLHLMLPHSPWRYYADGATYDAERDSDDYPFTAHNDQGEWVAAVTEQRHLLQAQYTDQIVGEILSELRGRGLYDDALVVVVADHGISFELGVPERSLAANQSDDLPGLAYAPLFIKRPGQTTGEIDDSNLQSVDLLPTVADILGIDVPFMTTGRAAGSEELARRGDDKSFYDLIGPAGEKTLRGVVDYDDRHLPSSAERWIPPISVGDDPLAGLYERFGLTELLGQPIDELITDRGGAAHVPALGAVQGTAASGEPIGLVLGRVVSEAREDAVVVAAVDGTVVAASPLHTFDERPQSFTLLFPPGVVGRGEVRMALVDGDEVTELTLSS